MIEIDIKQFLMKFLEVSQLLQLDYILQKSFWKN